MAVEMTAQLLAAAIMINCVRANLSRACKNTRRMSCSFEFEQKVQHTSCARLVGAVQFISCAVYANITCAAHFQSSMYHSSVT